MIMKMSALCAAATLAAVAHAELNPNLDDELTSLWEIPNRNPDDFADINAVMDDLTQPIDTTVEPVEPTEPS